MSSILALILAWLVGVVITLIRRIVDYEELVVAWIGAFLVGYGVLYAEKEPIEVWGSIVFAGMLLVFVFRKAAGKKIWELKELLRRRLYASLP